MSAFETLYEARYGKYTPPPIAPPVIPLATPDIPLDYVADKSSNVWFWIGITVLAAGVIVVVYKLNKDED